MCRSTCGAYAYKGTYWKRYSGLGVGYTLLVAGGLSLGLALDHTGILKHYAQMLITLQLNSILLLCIFGFSNDIGQCYDQLNNNRFDGAHMYGNPSWFEIRSGIDCCTFIIISFIVAASSPSNSSCSTPVFLSKRFQVKWNNLWITGPLLAILILLL
jgi:hypothetical protein